MRALTASLIVALAFLVGCGDPAPAMTALNPASPVEVATPAPDISPVGLDIPTIDVHVDEIAHLELDEAGALEIPEDAGTVGWYPLGPAPGELGPAILSGHVSYRGPGVFARLHEMKAGDRVEVHRADGTTAAFIVYAVDQYPKSQFPTEAVYGDTIEPVLRVITCAGDLDPVTRSFSDNIVVSARLAA